MSRGKVQIKVFPICDETGEVQQFELDSYEVIIDDEWIKGIKVERSVIKIMLQDTQESQNQSLEFNEN